MARVLAEGAVEIVPESEGFASELRSDLNRDLTAATAGLDRNVRIRVTTDVDRAEAQIRSGLARLQLLSLGLLNRIQTRAGVLYRFLEQRVIIRTANKIREWTQKTIQRTKLLLEPYWRWWRERVDQIRRGWVQVRDTMTSAAETVGRRWRSTLTALGSAFDTVRVRAQQVFRGVADAAAPHLARLRRGIETLTVPFRVVRAYGQASFRILGDTGTQTFRRVQQAATPAFRAVQSGFERSGAAASRWGASTRGAVSGVVAGLGRMRDGYRNADAAASAFSGRMGTLGGRIRTVTNGFVRAGSAIGRGFGAAVRGVTAAAGVLTSALDGVGGALGQVGGAVAPVVAKFALYASVAGLVTFAVGALGAALAGLPALLAAGAASAAVFALGIDGIKRAYETGLKPALDQLKTQVENVFERTLTPAFQRLGSQLIPQVTDAMVNLAAKFAEGGVAIIDMVNRADNIQKINALIDNTARAVSGQLVPALQNVIQSIIDIGANASVMEDMVGIFTDLANKTSDWLQRMNESGRAAAAVSNLRSVLATVEDVLFRVLDAAVQFFNEATPGFNKLLSSLGPVIDLIGEMGDAFGKAAGAAGELIAAIPQGTLDAIGDSIDRLGEALERAGQSKGLQQVLTTLADQIPGVIDSLSSLVDMIKTFTDGIAQIQYGVAKADQWLANLGLGFETEAGKAAIAAYENEAAGQKIGEGVTAGADKAKEGLDKLPPAFDEASAAAQTGAQAIGDNTRAGLEPIPPDAQAVLDQLPPAVQGPLEEAAAGAEAGAQRIQDALRTGLDAAVQAATSAMPQVATAVQSAMDTAGAAADSGGQRIGNAVRTGVDAAASAAEGAMSRVLATVTSSMESAASSAEAGGQRIATAVQTGADQAASAAEAGMARVPTAVQSAMDAAAAAAEAGGQRIATALRTSTDQAAAAIEAGMTRITTAVERGMQQAVQAATDGGRRIEDALRQAMDRTVQVTEQSWQRIVQAFQQGGQRCVQIAQQTGQQILSTFQALAGPMYSAGYQIISRLADGMIAAQGRAFAAAAATAAGIRAQFPSSPAKAGPLSGRGDPLRSGGVIMQRLAAGIAASGALVQAALGPILARLVDQVNAATVNPMADAARAILDRIRSGAQMFEDLTWRGAPANVSRHNDALLAEFERSGSRDVRGFLEDFIRRHTPDTGTGAGGGGVLGELQTQTAVLIGLRGDLAGAGYGPDMLARLDDLIAAVSGNAGSATGRAGAMRDLSELGAFP